MQLQVLGNELLSAFSVFEVYNVDVYLSRQVVIIKQKINFPFAKRGPYTEDSSEFSIHVWLRCHLFPETH